MADDTVETNEEEAPVAPPSPREVLSWKQKALKTYESRVIAREQQQKMMAGKQLDQFKEAIGQLLGKEYEVTSLRTEIDGVTFLAVGEKGPGALLETHVEFKCPDCGQPQSQLVRSIADIGGILSGAGEPHEDCPAKRIKTTTRELTPAEKLIEAFREFLASELEQVDE